MGHWGDIQAKDPIDCGEPLFAAAITGAAAPTSAAAAQGQGGGGVELTGKVTIASTFAFKDARFCALKQNLSDVDGVEEIALAPRHGKKQGGDARHHRRRDACTAARMSAPAGRGNGEALAGSEQA
jgi:hypothetical protein